MNAKILNEEEIKKFCHLTGITALNVLIVKNNKYYYAAIVNDIVKIRIDKKLADNFV